MGWNPQGGHDLDVELGIFCDRAMICDSCSLFDIVEEIQMIKECYTMSCKRVLKIGSLLFAQIV